MTYQRNYYQPRRPVKSFQDLEVYQKLLAVAVVVTKRIMENSGQKKETEIVKTIAAKLTDHLLALPVMIASAHSMRFSYPAEASKKLEEALLYCNLSVVYLEQYRDLKIQDPGSGARPQGRIRDLEPIEPEFWQEQIKTLLATRGKVMRLQMSWKKFYNEKKTAGPNG